MPVGRALQWPSGVSKKEAQVWGCEYSTPSLEGGGAKKMLARMPGGLGGGGRGGKGPWLPHFFLFILNS